MDSLNNANNDGGDQTHQNQSVELGGWDIKDVSRWLAKTSNDRERVSGLVKDEARKIIEFAIDLSAYLQSAVH